MPVPYGAALPELDPLGTGHSAIYTALLCSWTCRGTERFLSPALPGQVLELAGIELAEYLVQSPKVL